MPMAIDSDGRNDLIEVGGLRVNPVFHGFIEEELLPSIGFDSATFWAGLESIVEELTPVNRKLLQHREALQQKIDAWHMARRDEAWNHDE